MDIAILAIESSCDETSAAVIINGKVINNIIAAQSVHEKYGGVVPELASRAHQINIVPVVHQALAEAGLQKSDLKAVGFTQGPGLLGALLVGATFAKAMALSLNIPLIAVHHMQAHILAHFIDSPAPAFPFLCLTVSGGHTQIVLVRDYLDMEVLGQTLDDAVGEAFDKTAKLLGLPYPGGALIDRHARTGNPSAFRFPSTTVPGYDYSFSGIKTALLYFLRDRIASEPGFVTRHLSDLCASIQQTLIDMLMEKLRLAARDTGIAQIAIAGGVSANSRLRDQLEEEAAEQGWQVFIPKPEYCTDNAAMVAMAAHYRYVAGRFADQRSAVFPRMKFLS
jgi:N6-L-threonylcarbamoyladenine synthase